MFKKILIANRGEIACRVIRTCRKLGIATVAVHSEADRDALFVAMADESVCIGPAPARESYLVMDRLISACKKTGAEAVHPGYGFLSENEAFARRLEEEGIVFIGPKAQAIAAMGDKIASKRIAQQAGVFTIPGHNEAIASAAQAVAIARAVGYPVMIKASAGGGGKGLRVARNDEEVAEAFVSCQNEARNAFGDDRVFLEKFIEEPRHIEIQVLGDAHGNIVHLHERECSIQRRHQKVIEEAPSPFLDVATRQAMGEQAVRLARAVGYQSAGTVEFVVGRDKSFYFLEMNTRLQVEHPVTEFITGLDLVEWMIRIAAGERLPFRQEDIRLQGWAIECRINAEDPFRGFLPSTGRLVKFQPPPEGDGVRVDTGVYEGGEISMHYDSMIAKLITHGATREAAIEKMREALNAFVIRGVASNIAFQAALMQHPRFLSGHFDTGFIAAEYPQGFNPADVPHDDPTLLAAVALFVHYRRLVQAATISGQMPGHAYQPESEFIVAFADGREQRVAIQMTDETTGLIFCSGEAHRLTSSWRPGEILFSGSWDGRPFCLQVERDGLGYRLVHWGKRVELRVLTPLAAKLMAMMPKKAPPDTSRLLLSPMPGLLTHIAVSPGQEVKAGEVLAKIEAMKMENILRAERDVVVAELLARPGESLAVDQPIMSFR